MSLSSCPKLSVVIPVYNESATIKEILRRIQEVAIEKEIIVVDDGSTDGTRELLKKLNDESGRAPNIRILFQDRNQGKGAALRRGFEIVQGDFVLIQDADLEYDPKDYFELLKPIACGEADVVYGSRFLGGPHRVLLFWHSVGNKVLTTTSNMFTNLNLSDVWTCYKVFKREVLKKLVLREDRFGFEPEITAKVARAGCRIYEVSISYHGRTYAEGKKITWRDALHGLWCVFRYRWFD